MLRNGSFENGKKREEYIYCAIYITSAYYSTMNQYGGGFVYAHLVFH